MTLTSPQPTLQRLGRPVLDHARFGRAPAVVAGDVTLSHAELAQRVEDRAGAWGLARRLVLVEGANTLDSLVAYLAALQHGHVALVVPAERDAQREAVTAAYDPDIVCRDGVRDDVRRRVSDHDLHPDLALLLSTSGTTGSPKLVRLSRESVASNASAIAGYLGLTSTDRAITTLPLHYCYGLSVLHSHLVSGASITLTDLSVVDECFWELFNRSGATSFAGVPHTFELLAASGFEQREVPTLRQVTQAGGRLGSDAVRRWARLGGIRGWELVVMYGATEATARMAWLPPELAEARPESIGRAIPGGRLSLDEAADDRPGVGELVYTGPNVMLGYAESPADLGRGRESTVLRTGDLAREVDGLFEVVGRCNRYGKVFGLRIDLDALERHLQAEVDRHARVVATDAALHVFLVARGGRAAARGLASDHCGVPAHAVRVEVLPHVPLTSSGKPDYAALRSLADLAEVDDSNSATPAARRDQPSLRDEFVRVLGRPDATGGDSFVGLGGDSLSYVELATRLSAHFPDGLPSGWHTMPVGDLEVAASAPATPGAGVERRARSVRLDSSVMLRALAIVFVVASHVDLVHLEGGAHLLLALAGFNFARFQLSAEGGPLRRLRHGLAGLSQLIVPSVLWIGAIALFLGTYDLATTFFVRGFVDSSTWDDRWQFWFIESLAWITLASLALACVPALHRLERRDPFRFALALLAITAAIRFVDVGLRAGPTQRYTTLVVAFFFVLGWLAARAGTHRQRVLVSVLAVALTAGFFGQPLRELIVLGGFLLILWVPHIRLPSLLARGCGVLAGASLFIYLTHWQVYPPLEDAGHQWLALAASIAVGIAYARLVRPWHQAVGRKVLGSR